LIRRAILRPMLTSSVLVVLYFTLPLDRAFTPLTVITLAAGLVVIAVLIALQARWIIRSKHPRLAAIESLALSVPLFIVVFSSVYYLMERSEPSAFNHTMTRLDAMYFTVTVLATVGFGDIVAQSEVGRALVIVQMLGDLLLIGLAAKVIFGAVRTGLASRAEHSPVRVEGDPLAVEPSPTNPSADPF
jgi:voltage-gated potassium channel